jgi:hypothetical protein
MSRVYFHSPSGEAQLRGSERAWLSGLVTDLANGLLDVRGLNRAERLRELIHPDHHMAHHSAKPEEFLRWASSYETSFSVGWSDRTPLIQYAGKPIDSFMLALNTALTVGNDAIKLAARLHGSCEIHAWVDGPNRAWLADIMQAGLDASIYRRGFWFKDGPGEGAARKWSDQGWGDVITLLRSRNDEPVVTSYSVCDSFPDSSIGDWMPPWPEGVPRDWRELTEDQQSARSDRSDAWYDLDDTEQWRISMEGLRTSEEGLEMKPGNWDQFRFGHSLSVLDLFAADSDERLRAALGLEATPAPSDPGSGG